MGLDGPTCSESLPVGTCDFEPPEYVPWTSARVKLAPRCPGGLPACHGAESTRKDPRPEEKKMSKCQKNTFILWVIVRSIYIHNTSNPFRSDQLNQKKNGGYLGMEGKNAFDTIYQMFKNWRFFGVSIIKSKISIRLSNSDRCVSTLFWLSKKRKSSNYSSKQPVSQNNVRYVTS